MNSSGRGNLCGSSGKCGIWERLPNLFLKAHIWSGHNNEPEINALDVAEAGFHPESVFGSRIVHVPPHLKLASAT